jgi:hypothetical protein
LNHNPFSRDPRVSSEDTAMMAFELIGAAFVMLFLAALVTGEQVPTR